MLKIDHMQNGQVTIITAEGHLDAITSPDMEKTLAEIISVDQNRIIINFCGLDYISSAGLRILLIGAQKAQAENGKLVICDMSGMVADVFKMSGFEKVIDTYDSQEDALKSLRESP